jgi:hypothetical protein
MTEYEAMVSIAQTLLRARRGDLSRMDIRDITKAVRDAESLLRPLKHRDRTMSEAVIELMRRYNMLREAQ